MLTKKRKESFNPGVTNTQRGQERDLKRLQMFVGYGSRQVIGELGGNTLAEGTGNS